MNASSRAKALLRSSSGLGITTSSSLLLRDPQAARRLPVAAPTTRGWHSLLRQRGSLATRQDWSAASGGAGSLRRFATNSSSETSETSEGSDGESTAASERSAESVDSIPSGERREAATGSSTPTFAFAFDIDGVLLHSSKALPGAPETLKFLQKHDIPFVLLTNGGGKPEAERVAELSAKLDVDLDVSNFVQSHTPYQLLAKPQRTREEEEILESSEILGHLKNNGVERLCDSTVLVMGSDASKARRIAKGYGFQSVVTPGDILKAHPEIFPFDPLHEFYDKQEVLPLPKRIYDPEKPDMKLGDCLKIDAILVFNDPRDWAVDIQLIVDLLLSYRGYLGTYSRKNGNWSLPEGERWQSDGQPALLFSNSDMLWSTGYHLSRFGQGAFRCAVVENFRAVAKVTAESVAEARCFRFGKPFPTAYLYAQMVLSKYQRKLLGEPRGNIGESPLPHIKKIYMIGDNPASDISGANIMKARTGGKPDMFPQWEGCLVRTGVWSEDKTPLERLAAMARPVTVQDDVKTTVQWALKREGYPLQLV